MNEWMNWNLFICCNAIALQPTPSSVQWIRTSKEEIQIGCAIVEDLFITETQLEGKSEYGCELEEKERNMKKTTAVTTTTSEPDNKKRLKKKVEIVVRGISLEFIFFLLYFLRRRWRRRRRTSKTWDCELCCAECNRTEFFHCLQIGWYFPASEQQNDDGLDGAERDTALVFYYLHFQCNSIFEICSQQ